MIQFLIPIIAPILDKVLGRILPEDPEKAKQFQFEITKELLENAHVLEKAKAEIIKTEAASGHWLAANWRPLTALTFVGLVVARWFGFSAPGMTEPEYLAVYGFIEIMIGGYVVGRTIEKTAPDLVRAIRSKSSLD